MRNIMNRKTRFAQGSRHNTETNAMDTFQLDMNFGRGVILLQILVIFFVVWLTSHLGINPILRAVDRIKEDCPIPEVGANEFRYLAQAYNKMYSVYKSSIEHLNFKASHDELTGAYNRAGYELLLSGVDLKSTYMILFDVDHFKSVNDTYGHETGDKVLRKLVSVLKRNFRSDDYVCRIGGDEFVVFMGHASEMQQHLIKAKIENINEELGNPEDPGCLKNVIWPCMSPKTAAGIPIRFIRNDPVGVRFYKSRQSSLQGFMSF